MSTPLRDMSPLGKLAVLFSFVFATCVLAANYYLGLALFTGEPRETFFASVVLTAVLALYLAVVPPSRSHNGATQDRTGDQRGGPPRDRAGSPAEDA